MSKRQREDEMLLIDLLLGQCDDGLAGKLRARLKRDEQFARLHADLSSTFSALKLLPESEPPSDLASAALDRIRRRRRSEALLAREQLRGGSRRTVFSWRELAAAAAVIVLVAAIFVPSMQQARRTALASQCASNQGRIGTAMGIYATANAGYLPAASDRRHWLPTANQPAESNSAGPFKLVRRGLISPAAFQCPAVGGGSFVVRPEMTDFPGEKYVAYSYQHTLAARGLSRADPVLAEVAESMAILADASPLFSDGRFRRERLGRAASDNHSRTGQNVLYLDMHVAWSREPAAGVHGNHIYLAEGIYEYQGDEQPSDMTDTFLLPAYSGEK
ncbi:MAG: hypothetical protein SVT52_08710 [Planctomycetota bacterium]|nr:hypothetical protein [Planctomycetota bacterium]